MGRMEERITKLIDENSDRILAFAEDIFRHPELGFKEERTAEKTAAFLASLGLDPRRGLALTGLKAKLRGGGGEGPTVAILGELDAVRTPAHPLADPNTGAAHTCGHHAQLAALVGAAIALGDAQVRRSLCGTAVFSAVPAEEYGEIEFKHSLVREGKIGFLGGKPELIRLGEFDDIDLAITHHANFEGEKRISVGSGSSNGFIGKQVRYLGKAAHAAGSPETGINALNAALIGLTALNAQRETFRDRDSVRVHPIVTKGGDLVNVIPGETTVELLVRTRTIEAILDANAKATRAFEAGGHAMGARTIISDFPGYLPRLPESQASPLLPIARALAEEKDIEAVDPSRHFTFSTDVDDLCHVLPVLTFNTGGFSGEAHGADVTLVDAETA